MKIPMQVKKVTDFIFDKWSKDIGTALIWTTIAGWVASSGAQILGILRNSKYTKEQKNFMIHQEIGDAAINIGSFFILTTPLKKLASKLVKTGRFTTFAIKRPIRKHGDIKKLGNVDFDIKKLPYFSSELEKPFNSFNNFMGTSAAVIGSILSSNILTPILRNRYASNCQAKKKELFSQSKYPALGITSKNNITNNYEVKSKTKKSPFDTFKGNRLTI